MIERILNYLEKSFPEQSGNRGYAAYVISQLLCDFDNRKNPKETITGIYNDIMNQNCEYLGTTPEDIGDWIYVCNAVIRFIKSEEIKIESKK